MPRRRERSLLARLIDESVFYFANFLAELKYSLEEITSAVISKFGSQGVVATSPAIMEGVESFTTSPSDPRGYSRIGMGRFVGPADVPIMPGQPTDWRYVITLEVINPEGGPSEFRTFVIDADDRLRRGELEAEALAMWDATLHREGYGSIEFASPGYARVARVTSITRRS